MVWQAAFRDFLIGFYTWIFRKEFLGHAVPRQGTTQIAIQVQVSHVKGGQPHKLRGGQGLKFKARPGAGLVLFAIFGIGIAIAFAVGFQVDCSRRIRAIRKNT